MNRSRVKIVESFLKVGSLLPGFTEYWWENGVNLDIKSEPISKNFNCKISVGPLTEYQRNSFMLKLLNLQV